MDGTLTVSRTDHAAQALMQDGWAIISLDSSEAAALRDLLTAAREFCGRADDAKRRHVSPNSDHGYRAMGDPPADRGVVASADDIEVLSLAAMTPAPEPLDDLDRLFLGGPDA
jgi:hypothetical protein